MENMEESKSDDGRQELDFSGEDDLWKSSTGFDQQALDYLLTESDTTRSEASTVDVGVARLDSGNGNMAPATGLSRQIRAEVENEETQQNLEMSGELETSHQDVAVGILETNTKDVGNEQTPERAQASASASSQTNTRNTAARDDDLKRQYREAMATPHMQHATATTQNEAREDQNADISSLLERLNAVDRADSQRALEEIDAILSAERERGQRDPLSRVTEQSAQHDGSDASTTSLDLGALAPSRRSLLEPELSLNLADLQGDGPDSDMPEQRTASLSRPPVSEAVDDEGNIRPGAFSSTGRAAGQIPMWGRNNDNNDRRRFPRPSLLFRGFRHSFREHPSSHSSARQMEIEAVLVEEGNLDSEEQIRERVANQVRQELVSEMIADSVSAVPVDPDEIKKRKRRFAMGACLVAVLVAAVIALSVGLTQSGNGKSSASNSPLEVIATVPETICYDRFPGQGHSLGVLCNASETEPQGGGVANVVCKAWLSQMETADLCITNAGACRADFGMGEYRRKDPAIMLPFDNDLEILEMTGDQVIQTLNEGIGYALDPLFGTTGAYPYGYAIRYDVDAGNRAISNVTVNLRMKNDEWTPIETGKVYRVLTHTFLAGGGDNYCTLKGIPDNRRNRTGKPWEEALLEYAMEAKVINDLPLSKYSTQKYTAPPNVDRSSYCFE